MNSLSVKGQRRGRMAVKLRQRPHGSGKWWIFTDWKGKYHARYIPQGKYAAEEIARRITKKLELIQANRRQGFVRRPSIPGPVETSTIQTLLNHDPP